MVILLTIPVAMVLTPMSWLEDDGHTVCLWRNITGEDCYGCGLTRAFFSVMHLDFTAAWNYNWLVVLAFPVMAFLWARALVRCVATMLSVLVKRRSKFNDDH